VTKAKAFDPVRCKEELVVIPTYPVQEPDPNPMFFENRVYQGSSGKVYPNPFTDRVSLEKSNATYRAIFLENEFIQLMILPEIGGRIHAGLDKTNQYDFFYRQNVIKPALVGLLGPWISGGVEFNWPQHHRPSTYMPVHATTEEEADGSCTVWLSEHDPMLRMKGMVGIRLAPGKAVVEARVRIYNRTPLPQTFLWWANVAVRVHDEYQAFFPPDVTFVADHAKRAISSFPIARNEYYGVDYRPGTDIRWYKNIPVPTSYMVTESKCDFSGGYDHARQAGIVHTSNHFMAPGKKLWTWGNAEFGHAWDRNLTDEDGPYVELMAGAYTDNQPDFSWIQPYETKTFSQYWYPIQKIGLVKNANTEAAVNLELENETISFGVCVTSRRTVRLLLTHQGLKVVDRMLDLAPGQPFKDQVNTKEGEPHHYRITIMDASGKELISYQPEPPCEHAVPEPAKEPPAPVDVATNEELYLIGLHLEQYRHATRDPELYYRQGLLRDPDDAHLNNAVGLLEFRRGRFADAEDHFVRAIARLTSRNPNPYDGEPFYNLGLVRMYHGKLPSAYEAFYKAIWSYSWKSAAYYGLACIDTARGNRDLALRELDECLLTNNDHSKARALRVSLLAAMGMTVEAQRAIDEAARLDPLDFRVKAGQYLLSREERELDRFCADLEGDVQTLLDVAFDLAWSGLTQDAFDFLDACAGRIKADYPMVGYVLSWLAYRLGKRDQATQYLLRAEAASPRFCFPARIEEMVVLEDAIRRNPAGARAHYYLGNLFYDKRRSSEAIDHWRLSVELDGKFSIPLRNLAIAEFNVLNDPEMALRMYERAFAADPQDARLLYEWDQLKKRTGVVDADERLAFLGRYRDLIAHRDDLTVEYIALLNLSGQWQAALAELAGRRFSPWEGGEGMVSAQYVLAHRELGKKALAEDQPDKALSHFEAARNYPENLGEGKHLLTMERDLDYYSGLSAQQLGHAELARRYWEAASAPASSIGFHSYFQAQAMRALDNEEGAQALFAALFEKARKQSGMEPKIDYFATSLPNLLLFNEDLAKRNRLEAHFLIALAHHGQGDGKKAAKLLESVIGEDPYHPLAKEMLRWFDKEVKPAGRNLEVSKWS
jgi:tetratricopeptide (TPR) repeat protein